MHDDELIPFQGAVAT